jgi:hypothetical protein
MCFEGMRQILLGSPVPLSAVLLGFSLNLLFLIV